MYEKKVTAPARPDSKSGRLGMQRTLANFRRLTVVLAVSALVTLGFYIWLNMQTGAWQMLVVAGSIGLGLVLLPVAYGLARREKWKAAGYLIVSILAVVYAVSELSLSGATAYIAGGGVLLILLSGSLVLPGEWESWLIIAALYGIWIFLVNRFEPIPRFDVRQSVWLSRYIPGITLVVAAAILWRIARAFRVGTIRARLLITSVIIILLTAAAISAGSILVGVRNGRQQATDRLKVVATLREVEINEWLADVEETLAGSLQQAPEHRFVEPGMANVVATLLDNPSGSEKRQEAYEFLSYNFDQWLKQAQQFEGVFFMDRDGKVLVSTDPAMEGKNLSEERFFQKGSVGSYVAPLSYSQSLDRPILFVSRPILGGYGRFLGVLAGRVDASTLNRLMRLREQASLGETGESYLVSRDRILLTDSRFGETGTEIHTPGVNVAMGGEAEGSDTYKNYRGDRVIGVYRWLPDLQVVLMAEQGEPEALRPVRRTMVIDGGIALLATMAAGSASLLIARSIGNPLSDLAETATQIAAGDLERTADIDREDEIGTLARAFNSMTERLRGLVGRLEQRVDERTRDLELRSAYLEASSEVGRAASSILDVEELVQEVVELVRERFGLYYVGLFLLDETGEWAELRAGTGEAGQKMLAQGHKLAVGGESMIGQCVAQREARIALDLGEEAVHFDNPLLPETRSEGALPLQSRGRMLGALTVQSDQPAAFDEDTITVLQTMADQVAVALDNARLFAESQEALETARRAYGEMSREAWAELLRTRPDLGYRSDERGVASAGDVWRPEMEQALREGRAAQADSSDVGERSPLAVPIKVRGQVIGVLDTYKPDEAGDWTEEEIEVLETLAERLGASLESARLYRDTQRRAAREQLVGEITGRLWASMDPDAILKATVQELGRALDAEMASVEVTGPSEEDGKSDEGSAGT